MPHTHVLLVGYSRGYSRVIDACLAVRWLSLDVRVETRLRLVYHHPASFAPTTTNTPVLNACTPTLSASPLGNPDRVQISVNPTVA